MYLVQILLPLLSDERSEILRDVRQELVQKFGGITSYSRAPALGVWKDDDATTRDNIVVYEVMIDALDAEWWHGYRLHLQSQLRQEIVVIRALPMIQL